MDIVTTDLTAGSYDGYLPCECGSKDISDRFLMSLVTHIVKGSKVVKPKLSKRALKAKQSRTKTRIQHKDSDATGVLTANLLSKVYCEAMLADTLNGTSYVLVNFMFPLTSYVNELISTTGKHKVFCVFSKYILFDRFPCFFFVLT